MTKLAGFTELRYSHIHDKCTLDLFRPTGRKKAPLVILIHGGGWHLGHRIQFHQT